MNERDMLKLELWEDGALLHESHFKYQTDLENMIRTLLWSEKNCINDDLQHAAIKLLGKKSPRCSYTNDTEKWKQSQTYFNEVQRKGCI